MTGGTRPTGQRGRARGSRRSWASVAVPRLGLGCALGREGEGEEEWGDARQAGWTGPRGVEAGGKGRGKEAAVGLVQRVSARG